MKYDPKIAYLKSTDCRKLKGQIWYECPYCGYGKEEYDFSHKKVADSAFECANCKKIFITDEVKI